MTDIPNSLSPSITNSFAYFTFRDRLPVIITRVVDQVYRNKKYILDNFGEDKIESVKYITSELSRLRHELTTDKIITKFEDTTFGDEELWNQAIILEKDRLKDLKTTEDGEIHWFTTSFLFGENYMYRRIWDIILKSGLQNLDPFYFEKAELLQRSLPMVQFMTTFLADILSSLSTSDKYMLNNYFEIFLKMSLWGNEGDLSLSINDKDSKLTREDPRDIVEKNNSKLLIDDCRQIFDYLYCKSLSKGESTTVTFILDNSGSELLADLHLVEFLLSSRLASKVILITKAFPWYVSDVTKADFENTLKVLAESDNELYKWLAEALSVRLFNGTVCIETHVFFTLPHPYCHMDTQCHDLYSSLTHSTLIIFKGDLNYRKLVSDLRWHAAETSFKRSLLGFAPAPIVCLRVLKCDVQVGLSCAVYDRLMHEECNEWMITSKYGVIQSCGI